MSKSNTQITYVPKNTFNSSTVSSNTWYSKNGGPLKIWRKRGFTNSLGTHKSSTDDCNECSYSNFIIGTEFKMLGKYTGSTSRDVSGCLSCDNTRGPVGSKKGNVISFSGGSNLRSATSNISKKYYTNSSSYLESRNKNYANNTVKSRMDGVTYYDSNKDYVWPSNNSLNSSMFRGNSCPTNGAYKTVIYKPSNSQFGVQGAVSSSGRLLRLKTNTINKAAFLTKDKSSTVCVKNHVQPHKTKC